MGGGLCNGNGGELGLDEEEGEKKGRGETGSLTSGWSATCEHASGGGRWG